MKQIQNVKIIKKSENEIITEETIILKSLIKKEIVQQTIHQIKENKLHSEIISGIAKNSIIDIILDGGKEETNVNVKIELINNKYDELENYVNKYNYYIDQNININKNILLNKIAEVCKNISIDLGGREILRNINIDIKPGEVLGIIGPNGA
jgi:ABC-type multidrug transport system fused ATPase/permease subunit